jgi:hypothetical protein
VIAIVSRFPSSMALFSVLAVLLGGLSLLIDTSPVGAAQDAEEKAEQLLAGKHATGGVA